LYTVEITNIEIDFVFEVQWCIANVLIAFVKNQMLVHQNSVLVNSKQPRQLRKVFGKPIS